VSSVLPFKLGVPNKSLVKTSTSLSIQSGFYYEHQTAKVGNLFPPEKCHSAVREFAAILISRREMVSEGFQINNPRQRFL
jgi:hypothetical protein